MHLLKQKVHCYNYTIQGYIGIGLADSAAARIKFHPQLKIVVINPLRTVVAYMRQGNIYFTVRKQIVTSPAFTL